MEHRTSNRPFFSYVLTQSALVLIVLAASYLVTHLIFVHFGIHIERFWMSLALVVATQVPVAILYAKSETKDMPASEAWILAALFVIVTFGFELILQTISGKALQALAMVQAVTTQGDKSSFAAVGTGVAGVVLGFMLASRAAYALAVRCQLKQMVEESEASSSPKALVTRPRAKQDLPELYRRELIATNIGIFGLSVMVFGPEFMHVLKISIPLSIIFAIICVANRMAQSPSRQSLSARCLNISVQLLPMTVFSLLLMGASVFYVQFAKTTGASVSFVDYSEMLVTVLATSQSALIQMITALALIFALCLAANTLMLALFARLIKPVVRKAARTKRPVTIIREPFETPRVEPILSAVAESGRAAPEQIAIAFQRGSDLASRVLNRSNRTPRPLGI